MASIVIAIVGSVIIGKGKKEKKQRYIALLRRRLRAITLQGAQEKIPILVSQYWKKWMIR